MSQELKRVKFGIIGHRGGGKTSFFYRAFENTFESELVPTVYSGGSSNYTYQGRAIQLDYFDYADEGDEHRMFPLLSHGCDTIVLAYSIVYELGLNRLVDDFAPLVRKFHPDIPVVLVGMKEDLRDEEFNAKHLISHAKIELAKNKIDPVRHLLCSSKTAAGVRQVIDTIIEVSLKKDGFGAEKTPSRCNIM